MEGHNMKTQVTVSWCNWCGRVGLRSDDDMIDSMCRYCGDNVRAKRLSSIGFALNLHRYISERFRLLNNGVVRRPIDECNDHKLNITAVRAKDVHNYPFRFNVVDLNKRLLMLEKESHQQ